MSFLETDFYDEPNKSFRLMVPQLEQIVLLESSATDSLDGRGTMRPPVVIWTSRIAAAIAPPATTDPI